MKTSLPFLNINYDQLSQLIAQMLVYQTYLQRTAAPSAKRNRTLRSLASLLQRLSSLFGDGKKPIVLMLTADDVTLIKDALTVLQSALEAKSPSEQRSLEIQRLVAMRTLIEQTFPVSRND